ncbi:glycosyltransferase family 2 protein [Dietzia cercidiphylli]|uniref:glycosyltransferase family 2 protein n=1 Tax=Dietzia cercidiphylli TaxID=498199 RepID=UPI003F81D128
MIRSVPVAVVIPHYGNPEGLRRALNSVGRQTCRPIQTIVVDDRSPDAAWLEVVDIIDELSDDLDGLQLVRLPNNMGPATARNAGWEKVEADYVAFLDADDAWHPQKLEIQHRVMEDHPDAALSCHSFDNASLPGPIVTVPNPRSLRLLSWLITNRASTPTVMLRADITARFPDGRRHSEDYQLWLTIAASGQKTIYIPLLLGRCFKPFYGHSGLSGQLHQMELGQLRSIKHGLSGRRSTALLIPVVSAWSILKYFRRLVLVAKGQLSNLTVRSSN